MLAAQGLAQVWSHRGVVAALLWPVSLIYGLLGGIRRRLYTSGIFKTNRVCAKVIVVGNVVAGGAGKTPAVMALVMHLQARGWQVGVVSRGYGRHSTNCREVIENSTSDEVGDEPLLIKLTCRLPVFVALKRFDAAAALLDRYPKTQIIVSDDGLQHHALHRDLEICVFDDRGTGNGFLLPAGPLREPWPRPVDLVLLTGEKAILTTQIRGGSGNCSAGVCTPYTARRTLAGHALRSDRSTIPLAELIGKQVFAVAAIAQPERFFGMLRKQGLTLTGTASLPDHFDFKNWVSTAAEGDTLVCTEKDAVKLWRTQQHAIAVPLELSLQPQFLAALDQAVAGWRTQNLSNPAGLQKDIIR